MGVKIILADDHPIVLGGLRGILSTQPEFEVVGSATNGLEALKLIRDLEPELAVLDINMPDGTGIEILEIVEGEGHSSRIIFLTGSISDSQILAAVRGGAWGIVLKAAAAGTLIECLRSVLGGQRWLPPDLVDPALKREVNRQDSGMDLQSSLTPREYDLVDLVVQGLSNKHIARRLKITEGTVKNHLHNVYQKLSVANRTALATLAHNSRVAGGGRL